MFANMAVLLAQQLPDEVSSEPSSWLTLLSMCCGIVVFGIVFMTMLAAQWKIYAKAGQPGWAILIPIYGPIVGMRIIQRPWYRWLLYGIPFYGFPYLMCVDLYVLLQCFGKGAGFFVGTLFFPWLFLPILGFGQSLYSPPIPDLPPGPRPLGGSPPRPQAAAQPRPRPLPPRPPGSPPRR